MVESPGKNIELSEERQAELANKFGLGAKFVLLNKSFEAIVEAGDGKLDLIVAPDKTVPKSDTPLTVDKLINEVAALTRSVTNGKCDLDAEKINGAINTVVNAKNIEIDLAQLFLYISKKTGKDAPMVDNILEYAFKLDINYKDGKIDDSLNSLFTIKSVYIAVWKTDRKGVVDDMKLRTVADVLKGFDVPVPVPVLGTKDK